MKKEDLIPLLSDDFFFDMVQIFPSAVVILKNSRLLFYNKTFQELIQLPDEALENKSLLELTHPIYRQLLASTLKEEKVRNYKFMLINNKWVSISAFKHPAKNEITAALLNDFTEIINRESDLKESEEKYKLIFDSTNDAIIIHEKDNINIIDVNKTALDMFGYNKEDLNTINPRKIFSDQHPYTLKEAIKWHRKAITEGPQLFEWRAKSKSGRLFWVEINLSLAKIGNKDRVIASIRNIEQRKKIENAIYKSKQSLHDFIERSTEGIWYIAFNTPIKTSLPPDKQVEQMYQYGYVADCNKQFALMYGYEDKEYFIGKPFIELHGSSRNKKNIQANLNFIQNGYRTKNTETYEKNRFGNEVIFLNNSFGIIENGYLIGIWGMQRNITGQKKMEAQINQAQKMESIGTLAGGIAHDFNNILTIINGHAEMAMIKLKQNTSVESDLKTIRNAGIKAANLTKQLLAFSRKQIYSPRLIDINKTIEDLKIMLQRLISEDITLNISLDEKASPIKADTTQIEQILINLIVNARDAINEKESKTADKIINITTKTVFLDQTFSSEHAGSKTGYFLLLTIQDSGIGIDQSIIDRVFEPFFTTKSMHKGTGLGLSTVYGIVKQNKGYVNINSKPGKGTTVNIYWPVIQEKEETKPVGEELLKAGSYSETILFIDENTDVRDFSTGLLQEMGYHVLQADNRQKALSIINNHSSNIDLIISSILLREIQDNPKTKKILYTIPSPVDNVINENHNTAFLPKPFSALGLAKKIRALLGN